ncbi:MAG: aminotransferase class I/II-fold pyridoxal phosphate-dependent enzyme [Nannocystaceae bacterium]|nr:aminotransferase class I/II-fold pyridoxal phosphate-dependent enzyme [Nannocystaceae bacterium]
MSLDTRLRQRLAALDAQGLRRELPEIRSRHGVRYLLREREVVGFCSNDYLGLSQAIRPGTAPAGAASSRLICGDLDVHRKAEQALAELADQEDAVLFPSGYQLNTGVLASVLSSEDRVYSDALNHASLIDGLRLANAPRTIIPHLAAPPGNASPGPGGLRWWVTESIFSMDGDAARPGALRSALDEGFCVYIDDAHGFGLHTGGQGWAQAHGIRPTFYIGTLSKALGCAGAFVAASRTACAWIRTRARSFVFSTGTSPRVAESILEALALLTGPAGDEARRRLRQNLEQLAAGLRLPEVPIAPIVPIVLGSNERAVAVAAELLTRGWHVQAIRPPTVPVGAARLRLTLSATHQPEHIDGLLAALRDVLGPHHSDPATTVTPL